MHGTIEPNATAQKNGNALHELHSNLLSHDCQGPRKRGFQTETLPFSLPFQFAVPDLLYERELKNYVGEDLVRLGLGVVELDGDSVNLAITYQRREQALSLPDCFALALAQTRSWTLLSGDSVLRRLATDEGVVCHGVLWLLDEMQTAAVVGTQQLYDGLTAISQHPRCRLPKSEIRHRLADYAEGLR